MEEFQFQAKTSDKISTRSSAVDFSDTLRESDNTGSFNSDSAARTRAASEQLVASGTLPSLSIEMRTADGGKETPSPERSSSKTSNAKVDWNASPGFVRETERADQAVRQQMPEGVRQTLRDIKPTAVGLIENGGAAGLYEPQTKKLLLAERPEHSGLEPVLKHEFGHAFDMNYRKNGKPLSEDRDFRKLVDAHTERDPELRKARIAAGSAYYAEVFADLFASNLRASSNDLSMHGLDRKMREPKEMVRRYMLMSH